jgi:hypothetical protein
MAMSFATAKTAGYGLHESSQRLRRYRAETEKSAHGENDETKRGGRLRKQVAMVDGRHVAHPIVSNSEAAFTRAGVKGGIKLTLSDLSLLALLYPVMPK